ncbi:AAA family ATPase [Verrucomicrobiaceae bacterium N1E253]|uniref:AAA family ATPase n=1 Tax=Oceaniferula marina TaxID=2748318 RepID=A0A851GJU2_9BACT|nr:AAA domain-containing protein [Oceaniferula marina]NWK54970.1 AAA family ATPase [Oceaniferula marina]
MKIHTLNPSGCHRREIKALTALASKLPNEWFAYASLEMIGRDGGEIDLIICAWDRLIAVEIKDWDHPIDDQGQRWQTAGRTEKSPVITIREKAKVLAGRLKRHLTKKADAPWVDHCVLLTGRASRATLSEESKQHTFDLDYFVRLGSFKTFMEAFPKKGSWLVSRHRLEQTTEIADMKTELDYFFKGKQNFKGSSRSYNEFKAEDDYCFQHPQKIYSEFFAKKPGVKGSSALLRVWDFESLADIDGAYREESNRKQIALREEDAIGYLKEQNPILDQSGAFLRPISNEGRSSVTNDFFELYDLPVSMKRLRESSAQYKNKLKFNDRVSMATMLLRRVAELHELKVAHRDLGDHCVWVDVPERVSLSGFATAHVPDEKTISQVRTTVKANTTTLPEDRLDCISDHYRKDVFLAAVSVHQIIFGELPSLDDGVPHWSARKGEEAELFEAWFDRALDWEPEARFANAKAALDAFNRCIKVEKEKVVSERYFDEFKRERLLMPNLAEDTILKQNQECIHYRTGAESEAGQVKLWMLARYQEGLEEQNLHLLNFLERCLTLQKHSLPYLQNITDFGLTGMGGYVEMEWCEGSTLEEEDLSRIQDEVVVDLITSLVEAVWDLHRRSIYHGDIKPSNILLTKKQDHGFTVKLLDVVDYSPVGSERLSPAYTPDEGDEVATPARDGYALKQTIVNVLEREYQHIDEGFIERLGDCIDPLYSPGVANPDFEGTLTAIAELMRLPQTEEDGKVHILIAHSRFITDNVVFAGDERGMPIQLQDDRKDPTKCRISIYTQTMRLDIAVDRDSGAVENCWLKDSSAGRFATAMRHNKHKYKGRVHLMKGDCMNLSGLKGLHEGIDLNQSFDSPRDKTEKIEPIEFVNRPDRGAMNGSDVEPVVDVPRLWEAILNAEEEIIPTVKVEDINSLYQRPGEYQLIVSQNFDGVITNDWLDVTLETKTSNGWRFIGKMNIHKSEVGDAEVGKLVFNNNNPSFFPPKNGSIIRLQDKRARMSYERRRKAAERILQRRSTAHALIDTFSGDKGSISHSDEFDQDLVLPASYGLNEPQQQALVNSLTQCPLSLIQGPPGTGKTRVIAAAVHYIATQKPSSKILVVSQSHEAVNNATDQIVRLFGSEGQEPSLVRVGRRSSLSDDLISYHSDTLQATYRNFFRERLVERVAPVGVELGLPEPFVEEFTIVRARLLPLFDELQRLSKSELSNRDDSEKVRNRLKKRIIEICEQHAGDLYLDEADPFGSYDTLEVLLMERYSVSNMSAVRTLGNVIELALDWVKILESPVSGFDSFLVDTSQIVTGTCVGIGRWNLGVEKKDFDWVIIDEAARCGPSELSVAMQVGHQVILVGDHKQLPPHFDRLLIDKVVHSLGCDPRAVKQSDFHRVFRSSIGGDIAKSLDTQYRMVDPINRLVSDCFYPEIGGLSNGRLGSPEAYELLPEQIRSEVTWIDTGNPTEAEEKRDYTSYLNLSEIEVIMQILQMIDEDKKLVQGLAEEQVKKGVEASIGIITAYKAQALKIQEKIWAASLSRELQDLCKVDTVDSYQGKENPIIIFSPTRTNRKKITGHTDSEERINVSLSRAQERLIIVGSFQFWSQLPDTPLGRVNQYIEREALKGSKEFNLIKRDH